MKQTRKWKNLILDFIFMVWIGVLYIKSLSIITYFPLVGHVRERQVSGSIRVKICW